MSNTLKLPLEALKLHIDLSSFEFPDALLRHSNILGQPRAQAALEFGIAMTSPGYNIFVMGDPGLGRLTMVTDHLDVIAPTLPSPPTYAYVDNFSNAREPLAIELPAEHGQQFSKDIEKLIDDLLATFPAAFESPAYQQKKNTLERQFSQDYNGAIDKVEKKAHAIHIALFRESENITFAPIKNKKTLDEAQFTQLPQAERELFHKQVEELEDYLSEVLLELPQWRRGMVEKLKQLDNDTISLAVEPLLAELHDKYEAVEDVISYLSELKKDLETTIADYLMPGKALDASDIRSKKLLLNEQYAPNILIDNKQETGAPIIHEPHPIYLVALNTSMIKARCSPATVKFAQAPCTKPTEAI
jgi:AAA domain